MQQSIITINTLIMKKKIFTAIIMLFAIVPLITSCKKNNAQKDYSSLFKNTVWTGNFNYTGSAAQPASIEFSDGGQLTWHELSGDYPGTWKLTNKTLSLNFSSTSGFTADISDDNKFTNIKSISGSKWALVDAGLNTASDELLDNTNWTAPNLTMNFRPGNKLDLVLGAITVYQNLPYIRKGKSIRFSPIPTYKWFMVSNSATLYKGANNYTSDPTVYLFDLTKK